MEQGQIMAQQFVEDMTASDMNAVAVLLERWLYNPLTLAIIFVLLILIAVSAIISLINKNG
jgi:hypothetical protein